MVTISKVDKPETPQKSSPNTPLCLASSSRCQTPRLFLSPKPKLLPEKKFDDQHEDEREYQNWRRPYPKCMLKWEKSCKKALRIVKMLSGLPLTCCNSAVSSPIFMIDPSFEGSSCKLCIERRHALPTLRVFSRERVQGDEVFLTHAGSANKPSRYV